MQFEWDEGKRRANAGKHGFDFVDVWQLFEADHIRGQARVEPTGEIRFFATGYIADTEATVIFTMRDAVVRVISLRRARINERKQLQALQQRGTAPANPSR